MKKKDIIKKNYEFSNIINKGTNLKNKYYNIFYIKSEYNHYGISVPTKTGNAVTRNKLKRQVKNIIDNNKKYIQTGYDYVIILRKSILDLNYSKKEENLIKLLQKIGE